MGDSVGNLEKRLCQYFGRGNCIAAGRCTSAISAILRALEIAPGKVVLPTITNPAPANAVLYAGLEPVFCDVNLSDFNIDVNSLKKLLEKEQRIKAIIIVHLFGQPADMEGILHLAKSRGLHVIEDVAQAMGGKYRGRRVGSFGDASVVSFAHTKIIDVGMGGAALTDNDDLATRIREEVKRLPATPSHFPQMAEGYRKVYYTLKSLTEINPRLNELFVPLPNIYKDMYLFQISEEIAERILQEMDKLEDYVAIRKRNAVQYQKGLIHPYIIHPAYKEEGVFWRYSFLVRGDNQKSISERMRQEGFDISNWYPPIHRWYESGIKQGESMFKNADYFAAHVCNLWTDPSQSLARIRSIIETLLRILDEERG
jgi:dTDP-4-amino-4,6-dideoxygalactose transaminase